MQTRIGNAEYLQWKAFFVYRNAQEELAIKEAQRGR
jgi:hypothetical protein